MCVCARERCDMTSYRILPPADPRVLTVVKTFEDLRFCGCRDD